MHTQFYYTSRKKTPLPPGIIPSSNENSKEDREFNKRDKWVTGKTRPGNLRHTDKEKKNGKKKRDLSEAAGVRRWMAGS